MHVEAFQKLFTKEYYNKIILREYEVLERKISSMYYEYNTEYFSKYSSKSKYNGKVYSRNYLSDMHKCFYYSSRNYLVKELKKRLVNSLHWNTFCKESKYLTNYNK